MSRLETYRKTMTKRWISRAKFNNIDEELQKFCSQIFTDKKEN